MAITITNAKERLDYIISIARSDMYKPIQIAEVLYHSRVYGDVDVSNLETYQLRSIHWRDEVTGRLIGKRSTSSARYQHDLWNPTAMSPALLAILDEDDLIRWYERCLRGTCASELGQNLLDSLLAHFKKEFPQVETLVEFLEERSYTHIRPPDRWNTV